jgi:hypothetical protein
VSADFLCWIPALALLPGSPAFQDRVQQLDDATNLPPTPAIVEFVHTLERRYPDLSQTENTVWADGPMLDDAHGGFIDFSVTWDHYDEVKPFVLSTAHRLRLDCYDPQVSRFYPAQGSEVSVKDAGAGPIANQAAAIKKARYVCRMSEAGQEGKWQANLVAHSDQRTVDEWHVWYGKSNTEPVCDVEKAYVRADGSTSCVVTKCAFAK